MSPLIPDPDPALTQLLAGRHFTPTKLEKGPNPVDVTLMQATSADDVKTTLTQHYGSGSADVS